MNDYDKKESESMLLYMKEKAEENFNELFLHPYNYYTDAVIKRAETSISAIETAVLGPANKRERSALNADAAHIKAGNDILQTYLETMGRNCPSFDAFAIEKATRYGDPHYVGQVLLRERRALYALKSYLATAGMTPEEMCDKYQVDISACGPKRMGDIRRHIKPNRYLPFKITRSFRIRNKATDDAFYTLKKAEDYDDTHIHIAYIAMLQLHAAHQRMYSGAICQLVGHINGPHAVGGLVGEGVQTEGGVYGILAHPVAVGIGLQYIHRGEILAIVTAGLVLIRHREPQHIVAPSAKQSAVQLGSHRREVLILGIPCRLEHQRIV